jgi:wyosine [tRNA(Phe)-imidazoG37] synthetase (radical SAM superfamily)
MIKKDFEYIYGPVYSWRLGSSLGIDPISQENKVCSFDCIYCQIGKTKNLSCQRQIYVPIDKVINEINKLPQLDIDYITFAGRGEPTLAKNLGDMIKEVKELNIAKTAILTNSSLIYTEDLRKELLLADFVIAKLDAGSQKMLEKINQPVKGISFNMILAGIKRFKSEYKGKFALQIMFTEENQDNAQNIAEIAEEINPDEVQLNTPLRPCTVKSLTKDRLQEIKKYFKG